MALGAIGEELDQGRALVGPRPFRRRPSKSFAATSARPKWCTEEHADEEEDRTAEPLAAPANGDPVMLLRVPVAALIT